MVCGRGMGCDGVNAGIRPDALITIGATGAADGGGGVSSTLPTTIFGEL